MKDKCKKTVICLECGNWYYEPSFLGYSEMTPRWDAKFVCYKGHFEYSGYDIPNIFHFIRIEKECEDYVFWKEKCK